MKMNVLTIFCLFVTVSLADKTVKFAAVIFRHGDRTPVKPYPTDPWKNESLWPVKFGELTNKGKQQHLALGKWLRKRYDSLLSQEFDPSEVYVKSTDVDRTLMSAQANLAGLYPPVGNAIWDDKLMWQPIPIHTAPETEDEILAMKKPCPLYKQEYKKLTKSKEFVKRLSKYQRLMEYLAEHTKEKIKIYNDILYIYSDLYIETLYNFTLPEWTQKVYPDKMREPACYSFTLPTATQLLKRLKVGPLLEQITNNLKQAADAMKSENYLKLSIYSGHDDTVAAVLNSLDIFDGNCPEYTSTVLIELVSDSLHDNAVRISYRNTTQISEPHVLSIPHCGELCPLEQFVQLYKPLLPVNWEEECSIKTTNPFAVFYMAGLLGFIFSYIVMRKVYFKHYWQEMGTKPVYDDISTASMKQIEKLNL